MKKLGFIKQNVCLSYITYGKEIIMFGDIEAKKSRKFHHYKNPVTLK